MGKRLVWVTSSRADWGKVYPLIEAATDAGYKSSVFCTGMHFRTYAADTHKRVREQCENGGWDYWPWPVVGESFLDRISVAGMGIKIMTSLMPPAMVIVHGDRAEAFGVAQACTLENIRVVHIEGGETSGSADEMMRHCITKLSHAHFVMNEECKQRVMQLGEIESSIFVIGSPDHDVMFSENLPTLFQCQERYGMLGWGSYGILAYHPVTTYGDPKQLQAVSMLIKATRDTNRRWLVIGPNDDPGREIVNAPIQLLKGRNSKYLPSIRFEYFLTLLREAKCIVGNSSSGIREAPLYGTPTVNVGPRQMGRKSLFACGSVMNVKDDSSSLINDAIDSMWERTFPPATFNEEDCSENFIRAVSSSEIWDLPLQKLFVPRKLRKERVRSKGKNR